MKFKDLAARIPGTRADVLGKFFSGKLSSTPERYVLSICRELEAPYGLQQRLMHYFVRFQRTSNMLEHLKSHGDACTRAVWMIVPRFPMASEDPAFVRAFIHNIVRPMQYTLFSPNASALEQVLWRVEQFFEEADAESHADLKTRWTDAMEHGKLQCIVGPTLLQLASYSIRNPMAEASIDFIECVCRMPTRPMSLNASCTVDIVRVLEPVYIALVMERKVEYEGFRRIFPAPQQQQ